jgi:hypothetical protein
MRRLAAVILTLGLAGIGSPALASISHTTYKPGEFCAKAKLGRTTRDGKLTLVCKMVGRYDRWERR